MMRKPKTSRCCIQAKPLFLAPSTNIFDLRISSAHDQDDNEDREQIHIQRSPGQARHWGQFAQSVGLTKAQAKRRILELAKSLPATARMLQSESGHGFAGNAVIEQINVLIEQRCFDDSQAYPTGRWRCYS